VKYLFKREQGSLNILPIGLNFGFLRFSLHHYFILILDNFFFQDTDNDFKAKAAPFNFNLDAGPKVT